MRSIRHPALLFLALIGALLWFWVATVLPRTTSVVFASPDETAVMVFGRAYTWSNGFRLPHGLPPLLESFASLHPRSMVRQGDVLVPVGFLGMPFLAMLAERLTRGLAGYITPLLMLSAIWPLWKVTRRTGAHVATLTVILTLTFPTVILYANRGLFPNLPVVALGLWCVWSLQTLVVGSRLTKWQRVGLIVLAGVSMGAALTIRPVEALWLLPWATWAVWSGKPTRATVKPLLATAAITLLVCLGGAALAMQTYPLNGFGAVGYRLHDALTPVATELCVSAPCAATSAASNQQLLPFGFHPRAMWSNVRTYFFGGFSLWIAAALLGACFALRRHWHREQTLFLIVVGWTLGVLLLLYGQALYGDNIQGHPSLGNSFMRYLLPLVPFIAFGIAQLIESIWTVMQRGRLFAILVTGFFALYGTSLALSGDAESILQTRHELLRYVAIRQQAEAVLPPGSVIVSERSDKIFAGGPFVSVSPMPDDVTLRSVIDLAPVTAFFHRQLTDQESADLVTRWQRGAPKPLFSESNEVLYLLSGTDQ